MRERAEGESPGKPFTIAFCPAMVYCNNGMICALHTAQKKRGMIHE